MLHERSIDPLQNPGDVWMQIEGSIPAEKLLEIPD
jgi:hypothetical protein